MFRALQKNRYVGRYRRLLGSALASNPVTTPPSPSDLSQLVFWGLDSANTPLLTRPSHSGKLAVKDYSRTGDVRAVQPGRGYVFGASDDITWTRADEGTWYYTYTAINSATTTDGTITHGSGEYAFSPGVLSIRRLEIFSDSGRTTKIFETYCDEGSGTTCFDRSGNGNNGTITAASIGDFHDATTNDVYSAQNELGYLLSDGSTYYANNNDTGLIDSGVFIPRDDATPTKATAYLAGGTQADLGFSGEVPHHAPLGSPAITLDGTSDYLTAGARVTSGAVEDLYCSAWVKTADTANHVIAGEIETSGGNWGWQVYYSDVRPGKLNFSWSTNGAQVTVRVSNGLYADGNWHHVAVYKDGSSVSMWIDGVSQSITNIVSAASVAINDSTAHFVVGARNVTSTTELYLDGQVADVRLATGAAAATAAANIAAEYASGTLSAGCLQWRLGEGTGTSFAETGGGTALTGNFASTPAAHVNKQQFADTANVAGTGQLAAANEVDTTFGQTEAPITEILEAAGVDQPLTDADANVSGRQYQSTDGNKILLFDPAISGGDITDVGDYIS